jgi:hypothetical protein
MVLSTLNVFGLHLCEAQNSIEQVYEHIPYLVYCSKKSNELSAQYKQQCCDNLLEALCPLVKERSAVARATLSYYIVTNGDITFNAPIPFAEVTYFEHVETITINNTALTGICMENGVLYAVFPEMKISLFTFDGRGCNRDRGTNIRQPLNIVITNDWMKKNAVLLFDELMKHIQ